MCSLHFTLIIVIADKIFFWNLNLFEFFAASINTSLELFNCKTMVIGDKIFIWNQKLFEFFATDVHVWKTYKNVWPFYNWTLTFFQRESISTFINHFFMLIIIFKIFFCTICRIHVLCCNTIQPVKILKFGWSPLISKPTSSVIGRSHNSTDCFRCWKSQNKTNLFRCWKKLWH